MKWTRSWKPTCGYVTYVPVSLTLLWELSLTCQFNNVQWIKSSSTPSFHPQFMTEYKILSIFKAQSSIWWQLPGCKLQLQNLVTELSLTLSFEGFCSRVSYFCLYLELQRQMLTYSLILLWLRFPLLGLISLAILFFVLLLIFYADFVINQSSYYLFIIRDGLLLEIEHSLWNVETESINLTRKLIINRYISNI